METQVTPVKPIWPEIAVASDILVLSPRQDSSLESGNSDNASAIAERYNASEPSLDAPLAAFFDILLVKRRYPPFEGFYALPGGGVELDEDLEDAAKRELHEETGIEVESLSQLRAYGKPGRDPRSRVVGVVFWTIIDREKNELSAGSDAAEAVWFPILDLPPLAFDHAEIVADAIQLLLSVAQPLQ